MPLAFFRVRTKAFSLVGRGNVEDTEVPEEEAESNQRILSVAVSDEA
jgi:hypothetical protein